MKNTRLLALALGLSLLVALLLGGYSQGLAWPWAKGTIKGAVMDFDNVSSTLEGVKVTVEENEKSTLTDEFGEFRFKGLSSGTYNLLFRKSGFFLKTVQVSVEAGKVADLKVELSKERDLYSASMWSEKAANRLQKILDDLGLKQRKIALAIYKKSGPEQCELPGMVLRFATVFNRNLSKDGTVVVVRNKKQASYLFAELREQHQFRVDFDPATVARIGKKLGADTIIIGALLERKDYYEPLVNGTSVERQAYIPGLSINDILLKKGEARCD
jgi:hypothetical protein